MSIINRALSAARAVQKRLNGSGITYRSGETEYTVDLATAGKSKWEAKDSRGQLAVVFSHDWLIDVDDLAVDPQRDDQIERTANGITTTYQVLPFGPEGRVWRWHDRANGVRRIYTKLISEV